MIIFLYVYVLLQDIYHLVEQIEDYQCYFFCILFAIIKKLSFLKKEVTSQMDFRSIYLYEFKLSQTAAKTLRKINEAFGQESTNKRTIYRWFQKFRNGNINLQRKENSRGVNILENEKLKKMVERNPTTTVLELAGELGVSVETVSNRLEAINMKKKWIS
uniref:HTH_48 domain-containing protein n=1 Tax=Strongyloides papillosus TaxID=174720 RepID=A0A0N5BJS0_STREA